MHAKAIVAGVLAAALFASPAAAFPIEPRGIDERCPMARVASSLEDLREHSAMAIFVPERARPTDMWTCGGIPVLMFGPVRLSFEGGWDTIDPREKWAALAKDYGGHVGRIAGRPAYVVAGHRSARSGVEFVVNGIDVLVVGDAEVPVERLIAFAKTIALPIELPHHYVKFDPKLDPDVNPNIDYAAVGQAKRELQEYFDDWRRSGAATAARKHLAKQLQIPRGLDGPSLLSGKVRRVDLTNWASRNQFEFQAEVVLRFPGDALGWAKGTEVRFVNASRKSASDHFRFAWAKQP